MSRQLSFSRSLPHFSRVLFSLALSRSASLSSRHSKPRRCAPALSLCFKTAVNRQLSGCAIRGGPSPAYRTWELLYMPPLRAYLHRPKKALDILDRCIRVFGERCSCYCLATILPHNTASRNLRSPILNTTNELWYSHAGTCAMECARK